MSNGLLGVGGLRRDGMKPGKSENGYIGNDKGYNVNINAGGVGGSKHSC